MIGSINTTGMTPNYIVVFNFLILIRCNIRSGMPYLHIFVDETVTLLGAMTDKWVRTLFYGPN